MPTNDAIISWHTDPWTCGVAKFNTLLAKRLGVPMLGYVDGQDCRRPLISVKPSELGQTTLRPNLPFDLFLHGLPRHEDHLLVKWATRCFAGNREIAEHLTKWGKDGVTELFVPSLLELKPASDPLTLFSFGMAHKLTRRYFEKVRDLLGDRPYVVELSVAVHEGQPWGQAVQESDRLLRDVFGDRARLLGSLTDHALRQRLRGADYVLLFYPDGVRANNTTYWAANNERARIITNVDHHSPSVRGWDINSLTAWPTDEDGMWNRLVEAVA